MNEPIGMNFLVYETNTGIIKYGTKEEQYIPEDQNLSIYENTESVLYTQNDRIIDNVFVIGNVPEEITKMYLKNNRQNIVENIEVIYNNVVYQGDEKSQERMSRAIVGMDDDDTIEWTAKDNSKVVLLRSDLKQILRLAGIEQTKVW